MLNAPFSLPKRFSTRIACWTAMSCVPLAAICCIAAVVACFLGREHWEYFLYATGVLLFIALRLARGRDPTDQVPRLSKLK
jgi:hypothetical protein